jgi:hypothetical protein
MSEKNNAVLERIKKKREQDNGRGTDRTDVEFIQAKLRSFDREFDASSGASEESTREGDPGTFGFEGSQGVTRGNGSGYTRTDREIDENNSGINQTQRGLGTEDRAVESVEPVDGKAKPGGLNPLPSKRERKLQLTEEEKRLRQNDRMKVYRDKKKQTTTDQDQAATDQDQAPIKPRSLLDAFKKEEKSVRKPLSDAEANKIRPQLIAALLDFFSYADEAIYATHKAHKRVAIWSTVDDEEAGILVDAWLARAKVSGIAAAQVTALVEAHRRLKVGLILLPRFYQTFKVYLESGFSLK